MGTHPNVILMARVTPDGLARKTRSAIVREYGDKETSIKDDTDVLIGGSRYHTIVMEGDYDEGYQIRGKEGDILVLDMVTYGYGEEISYADLSKKHDELKEWCKQVCIKNSCSFEIVVTANYW